MDPTPSSTPQSGTPKRRACDECRARKLACSKEHDGCSRCRREGIICHYSAQKPMGRPRKRPQTQEGPPAQVGALPTPQVEDSQGDRPVIVPAAYDSVLDAMDLDMAFLDMSGNEINFLDLISPDPPFEFNPVATQEPPTGAKCQIAGETDSDAIWQMDSDQLLDGMTFDFSNTPAQSTSLEHGASLGHVAHSSVSSEVPVQTPDLSSSNGPSSPEQDSPPEAEPAICTCLTGLYLALDSLQRLPKAVGEAMRVARTAAKTAHDTILCPVCSSPPLELTPNPPIQSLQNMLVLGALLPSISNTYRRILHMVEDEAAKATREGRKVRFALDDYGGLWGQLAVHDSKHGCSEALTASNLEPHLWRVTVRSMLRLDVYGVTPSSGPGEAGMIATFSQPGLKDLIAMMEERTRSRHEQLDALVADGTIVVSDSCQHIPLSSGQTPTCMRIVDIAKQSMRELVIP